MYCVKCGVRLQDGVKVCPLCNTPVLYQEIEGLRPVSRYSDRFPEEKRRARHLLLGFITVLMLMAALFVFLLCLKLYERVFWSGYVMLGLALCWILIILPAWVRGRTPYPFIAIDVAALCGFLLYIDAALHGHWFLSFAFPVTLLTGIVTLAAAALYRHCPRGNHQARLFITSGLLIVLAGMSMLIEFFEHITFGAPMFLWSLLCVAVFGTIGIFLLLVALIPSLRDQLERRFFF